MLEAILSSETLQRCKIDELSKASSSMHFRASFICGLVAESVMSPVIKTGTSEFYLDAGIQIIFDIPGQFWSCRRLVL